MRSLEHTIQAKQIAAEELEASLEARKKSLDALTQELQALQHLTNLPHIYTSAHSAPLSCQQLAESKFSKKRRSGVT